MSDNNFSDILNEVKSLKKEISFYSPVNDKELKIYPLNLNQQKKIIENSLSSTLSLLFFNNCIFEIIKENYTGDLKELDTLDRVNISLSLRQKISNTIKEDDNEYSISDIIKNNKKKIVFESKVIETENFKFHLRKPNLIVDNKINNLLIKKYKGQKISDNNVNNVISDLYAYELVKFIEKIEFNDKEIDVLSQINNSLKLLNEIDSDNFKEVFEYINKLRDLESDLTLIPNTEINVSITPDFFIVQ
tara:strand:+ start:6860 stop:7600 length:741 start_codon:yes stop_codon:yes gene_type:complete